MAEQTWKIPEDEEQNAGPHGTRHVEDEPAEAGSTLRVEDSSSPTALRHPLGVLPAGARLCDEFEVLLTISPHERLLPGVYLCRTGSERVVVKIAALDYPPDAGLWARLPSLRHPNVLHLLRTFTQDSFCYEIQEYCDAGTLQDYVPRPGSVMISLPEAQLHRFIGEINDGLTYLHEQGIIHRDIKPQNIYLKRGPDGALHAVLGDFDISSLLDRSRTSRTTSRAGGTWIYTAPESFPRFMDETGRIGAQISRAGDYYALGICLLELLLGTTSLHTCGLSDLYDFYLQGNRVAIPTGVPPQFAVLLRGLLILNRHERWGAAEVAHWLDERNTREELERISADAHYSVRRATRPYRINTLTAYDLPGLADIMFREREITLNDLMGGDILLNWIGEQDTNVARKVQQQRESWRKRPEIALWATVLCCDPTHPFICADGVEAHSMEEWLRHTERLVGNRQVTAELALSDAVLLGLSVWLNLKAEPNQALSERITALKSSPVAVRLEEMAYLLFPALPFAIDREHHARTPVEFVRLAYGMPEEWTPIEIGRHADGRPEEWKPDIPSTYQTALRRWQSGALAAWLRQRGLAELATRCGEIGDELEEYPAAAFETILRLLDPSLPPVKLEMVDSDDLHFIRIIPFGKIRHFGILYRAVGPGMPFGRFGLYTDSEKVKLEEEQVVSTRSGIVTMAIHIAEEPFDRDTHYAEVILDSGFTKLTGPSAVFHFRMQFPGYLTFVYLAMGALIGAVFSVLPRLIVSATKISLQVDTMPPARTRWILAWVVFLVLAELAASLWIWVRAILQASEARRIIALNGWIQHVVDIYRQSPTQSPIYIIPFVFFALLFINVLTGFVLFDLFGVFIIGLGDFLYTGAGLLHATPYLLWGVWGSVIGVVLAFWHVAPLHHARHLRNRLIGGVFLLLFVQAIMGAIVIGIENMPR